ncbi:ribonuclease H, partial [Trifolium pratense]
MLVYNISVYSWPNSILKLIETWSRNFIWSGDISKKKLVIVSWKKCCSPYAEGGLGLRSLISLNEASNLRLCWELIHSEASWAKILCDRVLRNGKTITHHISSSLWSSIKLEYMVIMENSSWQIGNGKSIQLWEDSWCGAPLKETLDISENVLKWLPSKVSDIIVNYTLSLPQFLVDLFPSLRGMINKITLPLEDRADRLVWMVSDNGDLSLKMAYDFKRHKFQFKSWAKIIWCKDVPPS